MRITNSYAFIPKEEKQKEKNVIVLYDTIPTLLKKHFKIDFNKMLVEESINHQKRFLRDISDIDNKIMRGNFNYKHNNKTINVEYKFLMVDGIYYLDIIINNDKKSIIYFLTYLNNLFLTNKEFTSHYIPIITYDYVSENYCNKLYPLLNKFERKFRKLLFLIFTSQFKELYFEETASKEILKKAKENLKNNKDEYRIQNYFYSIDIGTLRHYLFDKRWSSIEEQKRNELLKNDLKKYTNEEIKCLISDIEPKSNWDRFFQNKGFPEDIEKIMESINDLRNLVAHAKIISEIEYDQLNNELKEIIYNIDKAIKITESKDFIKINKDKYNKIFSNIRESISRLLGDLNFDYLTESFKSLSDKIKSIYDIQNSVSKSIIEGYNKAITSDKDKQS